jgi:HTH-type transcriptional regulator / antitoxin HipB
MWAQSTREIGKIVAAGRRRRALSQAQLAQAVGVSQKWISSIEQGKDTARIGKVLQVLSFLGIRLQVGEAPWPTGQGRSPAKSKPVKPKPSAQISLADIIAAHSNEVRTRTTGKR